ncbi:hypothetical protein [Azospirillum endophyticum]
MKEFSDILGAYSHAKKNLDRLWQEELPSLAGVEGVSASMELERRRLITLQAFFFLLIAQFEAELNRLAAVLIDRMKRQADWRDRRVWNDLEHQPERIRNIPVMRKLALLTDKRGVVYRRIKELYDIRNRIAHGTLLTEEIDVAEVADELQRFAAGLNEAS